MKNIFILALLCLFFGSLLQAKAPHSKPYLPKTTLEDSTWAQGLKQRMAQRKSQFTIEGGLTSGLAFQRGLFAGFEYTQKTERSWQPALFINYSSFTLNDELSYYHESSSIEERNDDLVDHITERNYFKVRNTRFLEIGASIRYNITKKLSIKSAITFNSFEFISGAIRELTFDSVFRINDNDQQFISAIAPSRGGLYFDNSPSHLGFKDFFAVHFGIEQKLTNRLRITARASMPLSEIFPEKIKYPDYVQTNDEQMTLDMENPVRQPIFLKFGFSYTI